MLRRFLLMKAFPRKVDCGLLALRLTSGEELLEAARRREIDVVVVWRLDRWERSVNRPAHDSLGTGASRRRIATLSQSPQSVACSTHPERVTFS
jgi:hypothetical protein